MGFELLTFLLETTRCVNLVIKLLTNIINSNSISYSLYIYIYIITYSNKCFSQKKNYSIIQFLMNNAIIIHLLEFFSRERHLLEYVIIYI